MKNIYYLLPFLLAITGCNNKSKKEVISENLINEFSPIIQGVWDNQKEMEKIAAGQVNARDTSSQCVSVMDIETKDIIGTILMVHIGLCNGQGTDMMLKFEPGKHTHSLILDKHYELGYRVASGITTLLLYYDFNDKHEAYEFVKTLNYFPSINNQ
jgi:hypothetical protein